MTDPESAWPVGSRLGSFEILGVLGRGGMGEVYRARDTRLERDVAIKLLPPAFTDDSERVARFEREAKILASLSHPNIGAVYGVEEAPDFKGLVMELVEGDDLSDVLARDPVSVTDALRIARQIADAVEAAHAQGVVHRDLKPANIRVRHDGTVKVLDFGLAKLLTPASTQSSTLTGLNAQPPLLGTPAYMSPEQARGEAADRQADVWSFGVVLYELLTGVSPFARATATETLASVLETRVDLTRLPPGTPAPVHHVIRRCLEPDRKRRFQHIGDARLEIDDALADSPSGVTATWMTWFTRGRAWRVAAAVALMVVAGAGGWLVARTFAIRESPAVVRLSIASVEAPLHYSFGKRHLAISADGSHVAYVSGSTISIQDLAHGTVVRVPTSEGSAPFFSPDGNWVGFFDQIGGQQTLVKVSTTGGARVPIAKVADRPRGAAWRADGAIVFASTDGLQMVSQEDGEARALRRPDAARNEGGYAWPEFLPDGHSVLFTILPGGAPMDPQIALLDLATNQVRRIVDGGTAARYSPTGHVVYASGSTLRAIAFDATTGTIRGSPVAIPNAAIDTAPDNGAADFAVSLTGTLLFRAPVVSGGGLRTLTWVDRAGHEEPIALAPARYGYARISPDGTKVATDVTGTARNIWILDLQRSTFIRLTNGSSEDAMPAWTPDSRRIFFASNRNGNFDVYSQPADGATGAKLELAADGVQMPDRFTPDGTRLLVHDKFKDLGLLLPGPQARLEPLLHSDFNEWLGTVSPDGHWIAYESNESGDQMDIVLRPFPNVTDRRIRISTEGGRHPMWRPKGVSELYYYDLKGRMMAVPITLSPELRVGAAVKLFDWFPPPPPGISGRGYDISPIDGRFLMLKVAPDPPNNLSVVLNWSEELRALFR
jgi:eukaryotic-like serine/threonine-protein kinase